MAALPESDLELQQLLSAGLTGVEIARSYHVTPEAVYKRFDKMGIKHKGPESPVTAVLPWDIANHPEKRRLTNQAPFRGLRYYLMRRMGQSLSERAEADLKAFLNRVRNGDVLELAEGAGFRYVSRQPSDGRLVIRWPDGIPMGPGAPYFVDDLAQEEG